MLGEVDCFDVAAGELGGEEVPYLGFGGSDWDIDEEEGSYGFFIWDLWVVGFYVDVVLHVFVECFALEYDCESDEVADCRWYFRHDRCELLGVDTV